MSEYAETTAKEQTTDQRARELPERIVIPPIKGEMVHLRPATIDDIARMEVIEAYVGASGITGKDRVAERGAVNAWVRRSVAWSNGEKSNESGVGDPESRRTIAWSIVTEADHDGDGELDAASSDNVIGMIFLIDIDGWARSARIQVILGKEYRGRGYSRDAMPRVMTYGFADEPEGLGLHRIWVAVPEKNTRSYSVYQSLGFVPSGTSRDALWDEANNKYQDLNVLDTLVDEYDPVRAMDAFGMHVITTNPGMEKALLLHQHSTAIRKQALSDTIASQPEAHSDEAQDETTMGDKMKSDSARIAQDNIDEVIHIIRTSYDNAKENLMSRFGLDDVQAQAILDMRLKALQGLDREKLQAEYKELEEKIAYFLKVLSDDALVRSILKEELSAIAEKYGDDRKTEIQDVEDEIDIEDLIEEEECVFTLTENGYIKRTAVSEYAAQSKGGMGKKGITTRDEDTVVDVFTASTHDYLLFFTDTGKVYRKKGYQIPESGKTARGTNIVNILQVEQGERIQTMLHYREAGEGQLYLFMTTRNGTVKRLPVETLKNLRNNGIRALTLDEGDELINVQETDGSQRILIATHDGQAVCFDETDVRAMGRTAVGVRGIRLREGDYVVGAARAEAGKTVLSITERGYGKRTPVEEYRITSRGGLGIRNYMVTEKTGPIVGIKVVDGQEDLLLMTQAGILIRTAVDSIRIAGRATQGVIVMRFKEEGDHVISMALADRETEKETAPTEE